MTREEFKQYAKENGLVVWSKEMSEKAIKAIEQEPKTGHWIDDTKHGGTECSECGKWYPHATIAKIEIKYCSECGAKMAESKG